MRRRNAVSVLAPVVLGVLTRTPRGSVQRTSTLRGCLRAAALLVTLASASAFLGTPAIGGNRAAVPHRTSLSPHPWINRPMPGLREMGFGGGTSTTSLFATRQQIDRFHAGRLRDRGFTVLPEPVIDAALLQHALSASTSTLSRLLSEVNARPHLRFLLARSHLTVASASQVEAVGCHPLEQMYHFQEVCHRSPNRWDLKAPESDEWTQLCDQAVRDRERERERER